MQFLVLVANIHCFFGTRIGVRSMLSIILVSLFVLIYQQQLKQFSYPISVMADKTPAHAAHHTKAARIEHNTILLDWHAFSPMTVVVVQEA